MHLYLSIISSTISYRQPHVYKSKIHIRFRIRKSHGIASFVSENKRMSTAAAQLSKVKFNLEEVEVIIGGLRRIRKMTNLTETRAEELVETTIDSALSSAENIMYLLERRIRRISAVPAEISDIMD